MRKVALVILDGWGSSSSWGGNAISSAHPKTFYRLLRSYPNTLLHASGRFVGLPGNEVGNSEVGHMNLGAGNIVEQDVTAINKSIKNKEFYSNPVLIEAIKSAIARQHPVHLMGILSDAGIHAHINHLIALLELASKLKAPEVYLHLFTDGRDTDVYKGLELVDRIEQAISQVKCGKIATILGRVLLDRKGNWVRTQTAYNALTLGEGIKAKTALQALSQAYRDGETDEYITPRIIEGGKRIAAGDTLVFFNFRSDRTRQLSQAFLAKDFNKFKRDTYLGVDFISFIPYGIEKELNLKAKAAFQKANVAHTLSEYISLNNLKQFHIAETEKYAHVTFFINGNREEPFKYEDRILVPSPGVESYAEKPQMSAGAINAELIKHIRNSDYPFYICNFANGDMVGHTGNFRAALQAVQTVDDALKDLVQVCLDEDVILVITADHGNIEQMVNPVYGGPDTEHTSNPVPFIVVSNFGKFRLKPGLKLSNVASTCISLAGLPKVDYFDESLISPRNLEK